MSNHLAPKLKFSPLLFTVIISILLVSTATLWPLYEQHKLQALELFNQNSQKQASLLKQLLSPVVKTKNRAKQESNLNKALEKIKPLWQEETQNQPTRFILITQDKANLPQVLLDIGQVNISLDKLQPALALATTENNLFNIDSNLHLSTQSIYDQRFGLLVIQKQPNAFETIQKIAPYTGLAILLSIMLSWLILKFWKGRTIHKINQSQARYKQLVESSMDWIWETNRDGNITYSSEQCYTLLGYQPQEMLGKPIFSFLNAATSEQEEKNIMLYMKNSSNINNLEVHFQTKNGNPKLVMMNGQVFYAKDDKIAGYRGINRDITQQKQRHDSIISMALFDSLTQLPNRANLVDRLDKHLNEVVQRKDLTLSALLFIDLDGFKDVNDTQGHEVGDKLLKEIAKRMNQLANNPTSAYRLAGDEFVMLIQCQQRTLMPEFKQQLHSYISQLLFSINQPLVVDGENAIVSASIGVALIPQDGRTTSEILSHADSAMYQAKRDGKNCYRYFDASMQQVEDQRKQMAKEIREAIENNEFKLHYQLQINAETEEIYGMEALIRWPHPTRNAMISPEEFIQVAIESNHIQAIDEWVIKQSTRDIARLEQSIHKTIPVSINLSAKTLENPKLPDLVHQAMEEHYLSPASLRLEVTETSLLKNLDRAVESLELLRKKGIKTSIDDFGTGYSSLSYLQNLPIDTLKIDKSFIDRIATSDSDLQICRSIIQLAQSLDKNLIAEGVQSDVQKNLLKDEGCHIIQGFLYYEPQPIENIVQTIIEKTVLEPEPENRVNSDTQELRLITSPEKLQN